MPTTSDLWVVSTHNDAQHTMFLSATRFSDVTQPKKSKDFINNLVPYQKAIKRICGRNFYDSNHEWFE